MSLFWYETGVDVSFFTLVLACITFEICVAYRLNLLAALVVRGNELH